MAATTGFAGVNGFILKFSKQLLSKLICFLSSGLGPHSPIFSMCWCWERIANLFTCTGIGTTILFPPLLPDPFRFPRLCDVRPAFTRFHFARRFWNQIFTCRKWGKIFFEKFSEFNWVYKITCTSLNFKVVAIWLLSVKLKYFLAWNSLSNSSNCSEVNAVRRLLDLELDFCSLAELAPSALPLSSSSSPFSLSEHSDSLWHISAIEFQEISVNIFPQHKSRWCNKS